MPALNFMPRFVEPIRNGTKHHTIRSWRKRPVKAGDELYLYCGLRHPGAFRILPDPVICTKALPLEIREIRHIDGGERWECSIGPRLFIDDIMLDRFEQEQLAKADGFESFAEMMTFWEGRLPFAGQIIHWR